MLCVSLRDLKERSTSDAVSGGVGVRLLQNNAKFFFGSTFLGYLWTVWSERLLRNSITNVNDCFSHKRMTQGR